MDFIIIVPIIMILWGLSGLLGRAGVAIVCYGAITLALAGNRPLLIGWLLTSLLLLVLAFIVIANIRSVRSS